MIAIDWHDHATGEMWPEHPTPNFTRAGRHLGDIRLVVCHITVTPCRSGMAQIVAAGFVPSHKASSHLVVDPSTVVRCVSIEDEAWGAVGANTDGFHIEHCANLGDDWGDSNHESMLHLSAAAAARVAKACGIPVVRLDVPEVQDRVSKGFCGHVDVNAAFKGGDHIDPGPNFPWDHWLDLIRIEVGDA